MKDVLIFSQGGERVMIFSKHIVYVTEKEAGSNKGCKIVTTDKETEFDTSMSIDEVLKKLEIDY